MKKIFWLLLIIGQTAISMENVEALELPSDAEFCLLDEEGSCTPIEESEVSHWRPYLSASASMMFDSLCGLRNFVKRCPKASLYIALVVTTQVGFAAAANCTGCFPCKCYCGGMNYVGDALTLLECAQVCNMTGRVFTLCANTKKCI